MIWKDEFGFWRCGLWALLIHDDGWLVACDQVIAFEARWPRTVYGARKWFHHTKRVEEQERD